MKIIFVCTGNICRSPTAEGVLRHKLGQTPWGAAYTVESYGLEGWHQGKPPDSRTIEAAARRGYDLSPIRARKFIPEAFEDAALVLAMDREHYRRLHPQAPEGRRDRLFHFMDFAPDTAPDASAKPGLERLDVPDPFYGTEADFELTLDMIEAGAEGILRALEKDAQ